MRRKRPLADGRNWRRPLTWLPRSWRMTEREELTIETLAGKAARRAKVEANFLRHSPQTENTRFRLAVLAETVDLLDGVRERYP